MAWENLAILVISLINRTWTTERKYMCGGLVLAEGVKSAEQNAGQQRRYGRVSNVKVNATFNEDMVVGKPSYVGEPSFAKILKHMKKNQILENTLLKADFSNVSVLRNKQWLTMSLVGKLQPISSLAMDKS